MIYTDRTMSAEKAVEYITDEWIAAGNCCHQTVMDLRDELKKHLSRTPPFGISVVIEMIHTEIMMEGSQRAVAKKWGISEQYLSDVYRGNREPGQKILDGLRLKKVVSYRGR